MKMIKAMKRLKFWSRKKRKKISYTSYTKTESPPPPNRPAPLPPYSYYHRMSEPVLPSAPPLPPWLDYDEQLEETLLISEMDSTCTDSESESKHQADSSQEDHVNVGEIYSEEKEECNSYQQYMVPKPAYDNIVVAKSKKLERAGGSFGCFVSLGAHLVHCVFPCFHIREDRYYDKIGKLCIN